VHNLVHFLLRVAYLWKTEEKWIDPDEFRVKPANSRNRREEASEAPEAEKAKLSGRLDVERVAGNPEIHPSRVDRLEGGYLSPGCMTVWGSHGRSCVFQCD